MKAILVIDEMPDSCLKCKYCGYKEEDENQRVCLFMSQAYVLDGNLNKIHRMCPLKPLPQKKEAERTMSGTLDEWVETTYYREGWNDCIDELLGETE